MATTLSLLVYVQIKCLLVISGLQRYFLSEMELFPVFQQSIPLRFRNMNKARPLEQLEIISLTCSYKINWRIPESSPFKGREDV